jgi:methylglutaconyl-CoA hydratase
LVSSECNLLIEKYFNDRNLILTVNNLSVATIILNRVDKHNALDSEMVLGLKQIFDYLDDYSENNKVRILVLKANGKSFCAGADLSHMQRMVNFSYQENYDDALELAQVLDRLNNFYCPTIAVVNGSAYGGGVGLICCTDLAFAVKSCEFCLSEVKLGLVPAVISPYLVATMGLKKAKRYMLTAEKFDVTTAIKLQMLTDSGNNLDTITELENLVNKTIDNLLNNSPQALITTKNLLKQLAVQYNSQNNNQNILTGTADLIAKLRVSPEGQEGLLAFLAKRKPNWVQQND